MVCRPRQFNKRIIFFTHTLSIGVFVLRDFLFSTRPHLCLTAMNEKRDRERLRSGISNVWTVRLWWIKSIVSTARMTLVETILDGGCEVGGNGHVHHWLDRLFPYLNIFLRGKLLIRLEVGVYFSCDTNSWCDAVRKTNILTTWSHSRARRTLSLLLT